MQFHAHEVARGEHLWKQALEILATADEGVFDPPLLGQGFDTAFDHRTNVRPKTKLNPVLVHQPARQRADGFAWIDRHLGWTEHASAQPIGDGGRGNPPDFRGIHPAATMVRVTELVKILVQDGFFVCFVSEHERAGGIVVKPGLADDLEPDLARPQGQVVRGSDRLADGPDQTEVAHRGSDREVAALEQDDLSPLPRRRQGDRQPHDAAPDHSDICTLLDHVSGFIVARQKNPGQPGVLIGARLCRFDQPQQVWKSWRVAKCAVCCGWSSTQPRSADCQTISSRFNQDLTFGSAFLIIRP